MDKEKEMRVEGKSDVVWSMSQAATRASKGKICSWATDTVAKEDQSPLHGTQSAHQLRSQEFLVEDLENWPHLRRKMDTGSLTEKPTAQCQVGTGG